MNQTTVSSSSTPALDPIAVAANTDTSRCLYRYANGKRCRLPGLQAHSGFCLGHSRNTAVGASRLQPQNDAEDLSVELLGQPSEFASALEVKQFLSGLLLLVTQGRISPRRAAILVYITNQILYSHAANHR